MSLGGVAACGGGAGGGLGLLQPPEVSLSLSCSSSSGSSSSSSDSRSNRSSSSSSTRPANLFQKGSSFKPQIGRTPKRNPEALNDARGVRRLPQDEKKRRATRTPLPGTRTSGVHVGEIAASRAARTLKCAARHYCLLFHGLLDENNTEFNTYHHIITMYPHIRHQISFDSS